MIKRMSVTRLNMIKQVIPTGMSRRHQQTQIWEFLNYMKVRSFSDRKRKLSQVLKYKHRTSLN